MRTRTCFVPLLLAALAAGWIAESAQAAMQIRRKTDEPPAAPEAPAEEKPAASAPAAPAKPAEPRPARSKEEGAVFVGSVILSQGDQILADFPGGAKVKERFTVYGPRLDRRGNAVITRDMGKNVFGMRLVSGGGVRDGDRLARETESEAYARVRKSKRLTDYAEFLEVFPSSARRDRIVMEMFRLSVRSSFPTYPGLTVKGKVQLEEKVGQDISTARVMIKLDRFVIAVTDDVGNFAIEGIPPLAYPVEVTLGVYDEKFQLSKEVKVKLPAKSTDTVSEDIPVKLTPTYLVGTVVDEKGAPVREAEVWTAPYTMEVLTDERGSFRISRRKKLDSSGAALEGDEPLLGRDYEIYAFRRGFGAEKIEISAQSFVENEAQPIRISRQNPFEEGIPPLDVDLAANLDLMQFVVPAGGGPKINQ